MGDMDERDLWHVFASSGLVEDYLRYRGVAMPSAARQEERRGDERPTASDDRRPDYS